MLFINSRLGKILTYIQSQYTRLLQKQDRARSKIFLKTQCITLTGRKAANLTRLQHSAQGRCTQHRGMGFKTKLTFKLLKPSLLFILHKSREEYYKSRHRSRSHPAICKGLITKSKSQN